MKKLLAILFGSIILVGSIIIVYKTIFKPNSDSKFDTDIAEESDGSETTLPLGDHISKEKAIYDLKCMMKTLEKTHPAWIDGNTELVKNVNKQYDIEVNNFKADMTVLEFWQASSRIINQMHDAHTRIAVNRPEGEARYRVTGEVSEINGITTVELFKRFLKLWPYELESYAKTRFDKYLLYEEYLELLDIDTSDGVDITYLKDNKKVTEHFTSEIYKDAEEKFISYEIDEKHNLGILTLKSCKNNDEYKDTLKAFFDDVNNKNIKNIVVDLSANNGGWIPASIDFMRYINIDKYCFSNQFLVRNGNSFDEETSEIINRKVNNPYDGSIYVITSEKTFSAAMDFAMIIKDNNLGTIVGQTCGNMPDCYTYNQKYILPNTCLKISISTSKQNRINESELGKPLEPDYAVPLDNALDKIYELIKAK